MVIKVLFCANQCVIYNVVWDSEHEGDHYEMELTTAREWDSESSEEEGGDPPNQTATETK